VLPLKLREEQQIAVMMTQVILRMIRKTLRKRMLLLKKLKQTSKNNKLR
jgi:hypothetical protein